MPIVYVHGVATRDHLGFEAMKPYLERYIAPEISSELTAVAMTDVFWGGSAASFRWNGTSRPKTRLLRQGAANSTVAAVPAILTALRDRALLDGIPQTAAAPSAGKGLISSRTAGIRTASMQLSALSDDELSDVLTELIYIDTEDSTEAAGLAVVADHVARDPVVRHQLAAQPTPGGEAAVIASALQQRRGSSPLVSQGAGALSKFSDRLSEALSRGTSVPAYAASIVAAEVRPWLNELASLFIGDVLEYLHSRDDKEGPGEIQRRLLETLAAADDDKQAKHGEPLVVITHSMGGQLVYDAVTHYLKESAEFKGIRIDFWCATASQVGFFEELKLFKSSNTSVRHPDKVAFPHANLGVWWNVWDSNDFLSYTAKPVFEGISDESYDSGLSLVAAHSGYLRRPSFYRRFAARLSSAAKSQWRTA